MYLATLDTTDLTAKGEALGRAVAYEAERALDESGRLVLSAFASHKYWARGTGNLAKSWRMLSPGDFRRRIVSSSKIATFLDQGTKPHAIWPKEGHGFKGPTRQGQGRRAKTDIGTHRVALRFQVNGRTVFARMVNHPGTKARNFIAAEHARLSMDLLPRFGMVALERAVESAGW